MPMDRSYYDELEHLDIHCNISAPSGRVMWRPLEPRFGPLLCTALLTNISLWKKKIKNRSMEIWRTWRSKGGRKGEEGDPSIWNGGMTRQATRGFITQPGCLVPTLILGPKLWVMNISCDKWANRNSSGVVENTFAFQQTVMTPPGVWRWRKVPGEKACPQECESPLPPQSKLASRRFVVSHARLPIALMTNAPLIYESVTLRA